MPVIRWMAIERHGMECNEDVSEERERDKMGYNETKVYAGK